MARTIVQIYDSIITEKESFTNLDTLQPLADSSQTFLTNLTASSKVAGWRCMAFVIAVAIWTHEKLWDLFKAEVEQVALDAIPGTIRWYVNKAKEFQNGYLLEWNATLGQSEYADTTSQDAQDARIITQAAAIESNGELTLKVAKGDIGSLAPLSAAELTSINQYFKGFGAVRQGVGFAGVVLTMLSEAADDIKLAITIYYDPLVIEMDSSTPSRGRLISDTSIYPVEDAVETYLQTIPFNSKFAASGLVDAIQNASGVVDVILNEAWARYGVIAYSDILATTNQSYTARAGYLAVATAFLLTDYFDAPTDTIKSITYIAAT